MQTIPPVKPLQYPFNKVMIVYLIIVALYGAAAYFFGPWWILGFLAAKELLGILYEAYQSQKYLDDVTKGMNAFLAAVNEAAAKQDKSVDNSAKE
jgi:hypothetical protein